MRYHILNRKRIQSLISVIVLSIITIAALVFCMVLIVRTARIREKENFERQRLEKLDELEKTGYYLPDEAQQMVDEAVEKALQDNTGVESAQLLSGIQARLESGESSLNVIRGLFKDKIVVSDAGRFYFFPINTERDPNPLSQTDTEYDENGLVTYVGTDPDISFTNGIDVSHFQGKIDWKKVAADGVEFAIVRVGNRGYSEGKLVEDKYYVDNIEGALANGIDVGVYIFSQAIDEAEAEEEARFLLDRIEPYDITYPVVIDIESADSPNARTNDVSRQDYTNIAKKFCEVVKGAGYTPMIYGNLRSMTIMMDGDELTDYDTWFAYYGNPLYYPYRFEIWQYSSTGRVDGIEGDVDLNVAIRRYGEGG